VRARIATWSFAALIVGGAIVDATVLHREPRQKQANVEVQSAPEAQRSLPEAPEATAREALAPARPAPRWLSEKDRRPANRIDLDGLHYTITHQKGDGIAVEIRIAHCKRGEVHANDARHEIVGGRVTAFFPDGAYELWATCDRDRDEASRTIDTVLDVQFDKASPHPRE
jgi:hypothetical protein